MESQNALILKHLKRYKRGLSSLDAVHRYGITRLSGRIFDLRAAGHHIETFMVKNTNNAGRHAVYVLKEAEK